MRWEKFMQKARQNFLDLNDKAMQILASSVLCKVSVLIRRQQLTPKFFFGSFGGGQIHRKTQRIAETFKGAIKDIVLDEFSNSWHIQITDLVFNKDMLSNGV